MAKHDVVGTCFLVGFLFDSDDEMSTARIELAHMRLQDGHESLQATVTYSILHSFSFTCSDEICDGIVYDTTSGEENAKLFFDATEFFDLKYIMIKDKSVLITLRAFAQRKKTVFRVKKQHIEPGEFYVRGMTCGSSGTSAFTVFESFSRQELAFHHFDNIAPEHLSQANPVKLFSFESLMTGKRRFLVADMHSFIPKYLSLEGPKRHLYEIIREDFPCRLYFDLEYSILANPEVNGVCSIVLYIL